MIRFRGDVEGLRAVAVLLVILNHLGVAGFGGGFVGVDVFFVISGYLITSRGSLVACDGSPTANASNRSALRSLAALLGVAVIDPTPWLCVADGCPAIIDGVPVFVDGSHFTKAIADKLVPLMRSALSAALATG